MMGSMKSVVGGGVVLVGVGMALAGCSGDDDEKCPPMPAPSLEVTVRDPVTNDPICDAVVTVRFESITEQLAGCPYRGAYHGWGAYDVTVEKPGYTSKTVTILTAEDDECQTSSTVPIEVSLTQS
jgi:hypothetical protein